jgi:hypothetical protein
MCVNSYYEQNQNEQRKCSAKALLELLEKVKSQEA